MTDELTKMLKAVFDDTDVTVIAFDDDGMHEITKPKTKVYHDVWQLLTIDTRLTRNRGDLIQDPDGKDWEILGATLPKDKYSTAGGSIFCGDKEGFEQEFKVGLFNLEWKFIRTEVSFE